jgi:rhodanese-related sulfurtransferase
MKVLAGQYSNFFTEVIIVDCRYPYEFDGGHIEVRYNYCCCSLLVAGHSTFLGGSPLAPFASAHGLQGAINLPLLESIEEKFPVDRDLPDRDKTIIIFHCEFSSKRGPAGYVRKAAAACASRAYTSLTRTTHTHCRIRHLRGLDREANIDRHPKTCYPHVYLLRGGYKEFFEKGKVTELFAFT